MEFSDLAATKQTLPHQESKEEKPLEEFFHVELKKIDLELCRFCLGKTGKMVNIFDKTPELIVSIAEMIYQVTGHHVSKGDSFPKNICRPCLEDATKAFKIKKTYERSHQFFCQLKKDAPKAGCLMEKKVKKSRESQQVVDIQVKTERVEDNLLETNLEQLKDLERVQGEVKEETPYTHQSEGEVTTEPKNFQVKTRWEDKEEVDQCPVKNEPLIEEDWSEEDHQMWVSEVHLSESEIKRKKTEDQSNNQEKKVASGRSRPHKCSECPKSFAEESDLSEHLLTHSGEMHYVCSICDRPFLQKISLERHLRWHKDERTFQCSQCPKSFLDEQQLSEHILTHQSINPFKCSQCPKSFLQKHMLDRHFRSHTGERRYQCTQCEQSFAFSTHLRHHTLAHAGKSPYQCSHCPKSFFSKSSLASHILIHTGERPFKCMHCPKDFTTKYLLQGHIRSHTGERPYKCNICQKTFASNATFKKHMCLSHRDKS